MKKKKILVWLIVLIIIGVGGYYGYQYKNRRNQATEQTTTRSQMTMTVQLGNLQQSISGSGNIQAIATKDLSLRSGDRVEKLNMKVGQRVQKGEILLVTNNQDEMLNYLQEKNNYNAVKINGSASDLEEAKLRLEIAERKLAETELVAPFSGLIVQVLVEEGDTISNGQVVATIIDDSSFKVELDIDESEAGSLQKGQQAVITMESLPGRQIAAKVVEVALLAEVNSGVVTCPVTVEIDQAFPEIKPGYSADVEIIIGRVQNKIIVPISAVFTEKGTEMVTKQVEGEMVSVPVTTGFSDGLRVAVESGLEPGDQIVINTGYAVSRLLQGNSGFQGFDEGARMTNMIQGGGVIPGGLRGGR